MAGKVEGELGLKISGFQAALSKASHLMKEFGEHAKETAAKAGEQLRDITKETGGGQIGKMIGLSGASVAVTAFGVAVVETVKKASEAFEDFETSSMQMGLLVGDAKVGDEITEWIHGLKGAGGHVEDLTAGMKQFIESGLGVEEAKIKLQEFQKIAIGTGDSVEELAQAYRRAAAGGLDAGEGATRLLKSGDMLRMATEAKNEGLGEKRAAAQDATGRDTVQYGINSPEVAKDKEVLAAIDAEMKESTADWVKKGNLTAKALDAMLLKATGPGGRYAGAVDVLEGTEKQKKADVAEAFDEELIKLGKSMSEGFKPALDELIKDLPKLDGFVKALGSTIGLTVEALVKMTQMDLIGLKGGTPNQQAWDMTHGQGAYAALKALSPPGTPLPGDKGFSTSKLEEKTEQNLAALITIRTVLEHALLGGA